MSNYASTEINIDGKYFTLDYYSQFKSYYFRGGSYVEPNTRRWFLDVLKESDVIFDIGAHIGLYTILFSQRTKNVVSFEPTETYDNILIPNLTRNNITTPKLEKLALGASTGLQVDKIFRIWGNPSEEMEYNFTTLDDYITKNNISPNYLKIDVDSYDYEVLLGGINYLSSNDVTVCIEVSNDALNQRNYNSTDVNNFMNELGYKVVHTFDGENMIFKK